MQSLDEKKLFDYVRPKSAGLFPGKIYQKQVDGILGIIRGCYNYNCDLGQAADILGTTHLETGAKYYPVEEIGKGKGKPYGRPAGPYGHIYYGRGLVQITWLRNYEKVSDLLEVDFVKDPDLALNPTLSIQLLVRGMMEGWYTKYSLPDFIGPNMRQWQDARRVVNGTDRWQDVRDWSRIWQDALIEAGYDNTTAEDPTEVDPPLEVRPPVEEDKEMEGSKPWYASKGIWGAIISLIATLLQVFFNINLSEPVQGQLVEIILAALMGTGGILSMIGRLVATTTIGRPK